MEEIRGLGIEGLDRMFMEEYLGQAEQLTDTRQQAKVWYSLKDVIGIAFFALLAGNDERTEIADFALDEKDNLKNIWSCQGESLPMTPYKGYFLSCAQTNCRGCW